LQVQLAFSRPCTMRMKKSPLPIEITLNVKQAAGISATKHSTQIENRAFSVLGRVRNKPLVLVS